MSDDFPEDNRWQIWEKAKNEHCQKWVKEYEACKERIKQTTDPDATCKEWHWDLTSCFTKYGAKKLFRQLK